MKLKKEKTNINDGNTPKKKKKKSRLSKMEKIIMAVSIVVIAASVLSVAYVYVMNSALFADNDPNAKLDQSIATPHGERKKSTTILICGIDYLEGSSRAKLTDVIMVANIDFENKKVNVLQIPRDTYIGDDYNTGKINAIYSDATKGGLQNLAKRINNMFLIPIDNYVTINMSGFRAMVDAIGGVTVDSPVSFTLEGVTIKKGVQTLNGKQADRFVRQRKSYPTGDLMRNQMQAIFLQALLEKMFTIGFSEVAALAPTVIKEVNTDLSLNTMLDYYKQITTMGKENINFHQLKVSGFTDVDRLSKLSIQAKPTADLLNEHFRAHGRKFTWEELGIIEKVTDYYYEPPAANSSSQDQNSESPAA